MANDFHSRAIKLAKYEDLRPAAYGVYLVTDTMDRRDAYASKKHVHIQTDMRDF